MKRSGCHLPLSSLAAEINFRAIVAQCLDLSLGLQAGEEVASRMTGRSSFFASIRKAGISMYATPVSAFEDPMRTGLPLDPPAPPQERR
jgi:hypothetical protein